jgi:AraC-like DNA-binding protein
MVCDRCKLVVQDILHEMHLETVSVQLGEVDFGDAGIDVERLEQFREKIEAVGFELINDRKSRLIEEIRKHVILFVQRESCEKGLLSGYLAGQLHHNYAYLSKLFSSVESVTIEQFFILQKIEKTKELLVYDELTLTEIAYRLDYSSVAHLSRQFKKVTGLTPSHFKRLRDNSQRQSVDKV